jgi:coatomer subunit beta'
VIKLGREEPAVSMDNSGKIIWAKHSEIQFANIKTGVGESLFDTKACYNYVLPFANAEP